MSQIFHRSMNTFSRVSIFGAVFFAGGVLSIAMLLMRSPYTTFVGVAREQPVQFSHRHHVGDDGIDCRYCHTSVETSAFAGIPSTEICMNCHTQVWANAPALEPVRESWRTGMPIQWNRVSNIGDFAYFNHSIHVYKGVGCVTCHGEVDRMNLTFKTQSMQMEWCMDCHFNPAKYVRPREEVYNLHYQPPINQLALGNQLVQEYQIESLISCSTCHR
jgi:hypothetical protein